MVSFCCDSCQETVKKPKANQHAGRCRGSLTCIDCSKTFWNGEWSSHNSCISEAQAYQGALYKPTKKELKRKQQDDKAAGNPVVESLAVNGKAVPAGTNIVEEDKRESKSKKQKTAASAPVANEQLALLESMLSGEAVTLHAILKKLKAKSKADKDAVLKGITVVKNASGKLELQ
ncbi:hypothetical protein BCR37DRAFT_392703 [Protomyces lactucae-debilis]|uniref:Zinc finger C2H2 LYAR-type domain-containing protein n=1 Tax=Protomyces lactucae-debilis TaxID=2754530 RepID=A0A1Y2FEW7_PROLT|nr:uncharacterized protein BCR37DRAFT_392703 [Protomyces lactucae-debilis]ORY82488.1 hypothetical protein BCR37DRAFT_392703 [Protomyces lactucae-debilis]